MVVMLCNGEVGMMLSDYDHLLTQDDRTFAVIFGRPSSVGDFNSTAAFPKLYASIEDDDHGLSEEDYTLYRTNDMEAVAFFKDMINLSNVRIGILRMSLVFVRGVTQASGSDDPPYLRLVSDQLSTLLELHPRLDFEVRPDASLRDTIGDLSHYNALQVVATHLQTRLSQRAPEAAIMSARTSLQMIIDTRNEDGKTMCLWMWLYYAFTSAVVLFLHFAADPLHADAASDLALIGDLKALCAELAVFSDGAKRIVEVTTAMDKVAFDLMKASAKRGKRRRDVEGEKEMDVNETTKHRRVEGIEREIETSTGPVDATRGSESRNEEEGENENENEREEERKEGEEKDWTEALLENAPTNFSWDDWDRWLEDVEF